MRVLKLAPDATDVATAIYSGIFNAGIGAGALFGNLATTYLGLNEIGYTGAALGLIGLIIFITTHLKYRHTFLLQNNKKQPHFSSPKEF